MGLPVEELEFGDKEAANEHVSSSVTFSFINKPCCKITMSFQCKKQTQVYASK